ncbi:stress-activated map kinase-interacting protein 1-like isoform X4 [Adelges cooleyi]|uniref:stress-activated map kinase-interacting protein 1-like isoform X4 n=1 Tax=Adelges cooleyi TaxID=133065 RepID=UPI002180671C|nr:stress-activated map kinase-interacting protein 1-like isoform X4 [Adelges cooleyi]
MALYDSKHWLLSHIRNSFISSDDTGISEVVMGGDNVLQSIPTTKYDTYPGIEDNDEEDDVAESLDIHTEFGVRRQRSHTSVQLERLQRNMIKSANVRHVKWELTPVSLTGSTRRSY